MSHTMETRGAQFQGSGIWDTYQDGEGHGGDDD